MYAVPSVSDEQPRAKKRRHSFEGEDLSATNDKLDAIDFKLSKILAVTPQQKIPLGLSTALYMTLSDVTCASVVLFALLPFSLVAVSRSSAVQSAAMHGTEVKLGCSSFAPCAAVTEGTRIQLR